MNVTNPDVETALYQLKGQAPLLVGKTDPDLGVHEQAMVHIDDALLDACRPVVDLLPLLAPAPLQAVDAEEEAILGLHNVFFGLVSPDLAEFDKVGGIPHRGRDRCVKVVSGCSAQVVERWERGFEHFFRFSADCCAGEDSLRNRRRDAR